VPVSTIWPPSSTTSCFINAVWPELIWHGLLALAIGLMLKSKVHSLVLVGLDVGGGCL